MDTMKKNKCILMEEIRKCSAKPMNRERAAYLNVCRGAYKAVCLAMEDREAGGDHEEHDVRLDRKTAEKWVSNMENADGTRGPHWTMEKTDEVRKQFSLSCDPLQFWVTMNMMYSDYCRVAEKLGVNTVEFYVCMTKAFLEDPDAQPDKLARYWEDIARH